MEQFGGQVGFTTFHSLFQSHLLASDIRFPLSSYSFSRILIACTFCRNELDEIRGTLSSIDVVVSHTITDTHYLPSLLHTLDPISS